MSDFTLEVDASGIAIIKWDVPGRSMNIMSMQGFEDLNSQIDCALEDPAVIGIVIASGKRDFAAGMDLNVLAGLRRQAEKESPKPLYDAFMRVHAILRKIEKAGMPLEAGGQAKPVAAAITGTALGIGYEIPLACHRIFCAENPKARIGLPEIKVGLFPGAGGTTRLMRKFGLMGAAPYLLEGKTLDPASAVKAGLVDQIVPASELLQAASTWVIDTAPSGYSKPWDRRGYRIPGGSPFSRDGFATFTGAAAMVNGRTMGGLPGAKSLLAAIYEGAVVNFDAALSIEARHFTELIMNPSSEAMIRTLFVNKKALEKGIRRPAGANPSEIARIGVAGAGMMGSGIALAAARARFDVALMDETPEKADSGKSQASKVLNGEISKGRLAANEADAILARIFTGGDCSIFQECDIVIEAVFEEFAVKNSVHKRIERQIGAGAILATNTSTLPISELAGQVERPGNFIGMHFFSPVNRMPLLEIIRGKSTGDAAVAAALDFAAKIRKTPIVVNDARFFYANRCIIPYLNEAIRMVREGIAPALIENGAKLAGMPIGPLQVVDETSIKLALDIAKMTRKASGSNYADHDVDEVIAALAERKRLGRKYGAGFYEYDRKGRRLGLWDGLRDLWPARPNQPELNEVKDRLLLVQALEATRALQAGVLDDIREGDVGAVLGWGFAPWSGGPFSWLDIVGAESAVEKANAYAERFGSRFKAPELLVEMAGSGREFYSQA
ncbi:MAG: 3-hydroxyacyl-CoA dehydrogenase NAD-binding domain-containing protein [Albidovulum sp.]|nr:3-hydroxyacyl-CoA dehydrogenase NAD-binding domain-containing protein [Albidovulum sp.]